tara:strand:+ start:5529 stop:7067 length:1539 start_codon:yes stop_codon:yes gene_type:complete
MVTKNKVPIKTIALYAKEFQEASKKFADKNLAGYTCSVILRDSISKSLKNSVYAVKCEDTLDDLIWGSFKRATCAYPTKVEGDSVTFKYYKKTITYTKAQLCQSEEKMATQKEMLDLFEETLKTTGLPSYKELRTFEENNRTVSKDFDDYVLSSKKDISSLSEEVVSLKTAMKGMSTTKKEKVKVAADGTIPSGSMVFKSVEKLFPNVKFSKDFEVPCWEWDGDHPEVPEVDENYEFRFESLMAVLRSILTNEPCYIQGHTGSGKTTLVSQVAAHLNWPFVRFNFDSEVSRMDMIGRETLTTAKGGDGSLTTISRFVEGFLPKALAGNYIACFDEIDFVRPDVAYVMQRVFEGEGLTIAEDGGRVVHANPNFRMFATGNTVGQGDEHGMYQGARPQSMAMLDRFTTWTKVPYLNRIERKRLIKRTCPTLSSNVVNALNKYVTEHIQSFEESKVLQSISPRGFLSIAKACVLMEDMYDGDEMSILKEALTMAVLDKASTTDRMVLNELVQRCA